MQKYSHDLKLTTHSHLMQRLKMSIAIPSLLHTYEVYTKSHEQLFFACELGTADEGESGGRWNQLLCYP